MKKGFTIVELVVIMTIMAVLASIGILSYLNSQKKVRDSKRVTEVKTIQTAVEMYLSVNKDLPGVAGSWYQSNHNPYWKGTQSTGDIAFQTEVAPFMAELPIDPLNRPYGTELTYRYQWGGGACPVIAGIPTPTIAGPVYKLDAGMEVSIDLVDNDNGRRPRPDQARSVIKSNGELSGRYEVGTCLTLLN